jgi:hypothetical protein
MEPPLRGDDGGGRVSGGQRLQGNGRGLRIQIEGNGFGTGMDAEFAKDVPHMGSDGAFVNTQIGGDSLLGMSPGHEGQNLRFAFGEAVHD